MIQRQINGRKRPVARAVAVPLTRATFLGYHHIAMDDPSHGSLKASNISLGSPIHPILLCLYSYSPPPSFPLPRDQA